MRIGKLPTDDDFNKFRFETLETVLLILAFVPIVRLDLTSNSKTNNLAMFNYFEQHAGTYQFDTTYFDELVVTINSHATISTFKSCNAMLQTIAPKETEQKRKDLVVVGNGIYNKETKTLEPFRPDYVTTTKIKSVVCIYDFDEESLTYGRYVPAQELMMDIIRDIEPFKTASHYQHTYKVLTAFVPHKEEKVIENNTVIEFLDEFLPRFKWEVLPTKFLYELYKAWMSKDNANEKPVKKSVFIKHSADFFSEQPGWSIRLARGDKITIGTRMDADEPLITEYNLTNYMNPNYKGSDLRTKRAFTRPKTTRGYAKLKYSTDSR